APDWFDFHRCDPNPNRVSLWFVQHQDTSSPSQPEFHLDLDRLGEQLVQFVAESNANDASTPLISLLSSQSTLPSGLYRLDLVDANESVGADNLYKAVIVQSDVQEPQPLTRSLHSPVSNRCDTDHFDLFLHKHTSKTSPILIPVSKVQSRFDPLHSNTYQLK